MARLFGRKDRRRHELLSAYVDGEVTAEEAREVEELLDSSDDAPRELAELQATVDLVRGLPELETPRSFALDEAPQKPWTLWWPSVRTTGLATSLAAMLLVALVAGDMLNVLEQAQFGADDSEYASDDSGFALSAAPEAAPESAEVTAMDDPASPEPEAALMKSAAVQEDSAQAQSAPAAAALRMAAAPSDEEPATAMQQDTTGEAPQAAEAAESADGPQVAVQSVMSADAPRADEAESVEEQLSEAQQRLEEEALAAVQQLAAQDEQPLLEEIDEPAGDGISLPLVELQMVTAAIVFVSIGATLIAILRRRRSGL